MSIFTNPSKLLKINSINKNEFNNLKETSEKISKNKKSFDNNDLHQYIPNKNFNHTKNAIPIKNSNLPYKNPIELIDKINNNKINFIQNNSININTTNQNQKNSNNFYNNIEFRNLISSEGSKYKLSNCNNSKINLFNFTSRTCSENEFNLVTDRKEKKNAFNSTKSNNSKKFFPINFNQIKHPFLNKKKETIICLEKKKKIINFSLNYKNEEIKNIHLNDTKDVNIFEYNNYKENKLVLSKYKKENNGFFILKKDFFLKSFLENKPNYNVNLNEVSEEKNNNNLWKNDLKINNNVKINTIKIFNHEKCEEPTSPFTNENYLENNNSNFTLENNFTKDETKNINRNYSLENHESSNLTKENLINITEEITNSNREINKSTKQNFPVERTLNQKYFDNNKKHITENDKGELSEKMENNKNNNRTIVPLLTKTPKKERKISNDKIFHNEIIKGNFPKDYISNKFNNKTKININSSKNLQINKEDSDLLASPPRYELKPLNKKKWNNTNNFNLYSNVNNYNKTKNNIENEYVKENYSAKNLYHECNYKNAIENNSLLKISKELSNNTFNEIFDENEFIVKTNENIKKDYNKDNNVNHRPKIKINSKRIKTNYVYINTTKINNLNNNSSFENSNNSIKNSLDNKENTDYLNINENEIIKSNTHFDSENIINYINKSNEDLNNDKVFENSSIINKKVEKNETLKIDKGFQSDFENLDKSVGKTSNLEEKIQNNEILKISFDNNIKNKNKIIPHLDKYLFLKKKNFQSLNNLKILNNNKNKIISDSKKMNTVIKRKANKIKNKDIINIFNTKS